MTYALITIPVVALILGFIGGYLIGRYQTSLLNKIQVLQASQPEPTPEPEKPTVAGGAYMPPREISNATDKKKSAGIVESKTPEQMEWEAKQEMAKLEQGA